MELTDNEILIIEAINSNDVGKICEMFAKRYCYDIFKKENIGLFDKNTKYLKYFRGYYYYIHFGNFKKAKILMKYNNPFIFLHSYFALLYYDLKRYNKVKYYMRKLKCDKTQEYWQNRYLSFCYEHKYKRLYYYLKNESKYVMCKKKYFIHLIFMEI